MKHFLKFTFLCIVLIFNACSGDDTASDDQNNDPQDPASPKLIKLVYSQPNGEGWTANYTYHTNGYVQTETMTYTNAPGYEHEYIYEDDRLIRIMNNNTLFIDFTYENDRIINYEEHELEQLYSLTYDAQGRIIDSHATDPDGNVLCNVLFTYEGNAENHKTREITCVEITATYTYDSSDNPRYAMVTPAFAKAIGRPSKNWLSESIINLYANTTSLINHNYTYNSSGQITEEVIFNGGTIEGTYTYTYE